MSGADVRRLLLLRHAKAETPGMLADELRPLALRGRRQCPEIAARLTEAGYLPERVLVSSAVRTRQTWELVRSAMTAVPAPEVEVTDRLYEAGLRAMLDVVGEVDERVRTVLVVAHEPTVSAVASYLAGDQGDPAHLAQVRTGVPTATCSVLELDAAWSDVGPGRGRLVDLLRATA